MYRAITAFFELTGIGLMTYGAWLHYAPLGFFVCGSLIWFEVNGNVFKGT
jgi:hypothetical protein|tara:strand:- start:1417 stop:1566 length:150 start_codon:yes stop_codon:yes gene_type:complete